MTTTEYLKEHGINGAHRLSEADRKRICRMDLMAWDYETEIINRGRLCGSRFVDRDAKKLGIKIDWRG